jgi:uncharacterized protein YcnI
MRTFSTAVLAAALSLALASPALAHVTVQPSEAPAGSFYRFVVRVPNERDDADTTKVEVQFPTNVTNASIQPKPGWNYEVKMTKLDEPIEVFGEEVDEVVGSVTWTGGSIAPGEFDEFGFSIRTPDAPGELEFPALQTYSGGEVVRWVGPADADEPAARVNVLDLGLEEGEGGPLAQQAAMSEQIAALKNQVEELEQAPAASNETEDDSSNLGILLGGLGAALAAIALIVVLTRRRSA